MKKAFLLFIGIIIYSSAICQKHDHIWLVGANDGINFLHDNYEFNFNKNPTEVKSIVIEPNYFWTSSSYCDKIGNLLLYTDGLSIYGANNSIIAGGEKINPGLGWDIWSQAPLGYNVPQGAFFLPAPGNDSIVYLFHSSEDDFINFDKFYYTKIKIKENSDPIVTEANNLQLEGMAMLPASANKHSNGRDWWVIVPDAKKNIYYKFLLTPNGLEGPWEQHIGVGKTEGSRSRVNSFSPNGDYYIDYSGIFGFSLYNFDRCTGELSDEYRLNFNERDTIEFSFGAAFSPNSRFLYLSTNWLTYRFGNTPHDAQNPLLIQYDLQAADIAATADTIGVKDTILNVLPSNFLGIEYNMLQLAPDGKIYTITEKSKIHSIQEPNKKGKASRLKKRYPYVEKGVSTTALYYPNYRLGPIDGSTCDTLGINNNPIANYRWENWDSLNPLHIEFTDLSYYEPAEWFWEFESLGTSRDTNPEFTFPAPGVYEVCLTVRNVNSLNTTCKNVPVGGVTSVEEVFETVGLNVFPNPNSGQMTFEFEAIRDSSSEILVTDLLGKVIKNIPLGKGQTSSGIELSNKQSGIYIAIMKSGEEVKSVRRFVIQK